MWCEGAAWIQLAQERTEWWVFVNTVMKFRVSRKQETSWQDESRLYYEDRWDFIILLRKRVNCSYVVYLSDTDTMVSFTLVPACLSFSSSMAERLSVQNPHILCCVCTIWTSKIPPVWRRGRAAGQIAPGERVLQCTPPGLVCATPRALSALSERPSSPNQMLREPSREAKPCDIRVTCRGETPNDFN